MKFDFSFRKLGLPIVLASVGLYAAAFFLIRRAGCGGTEGTLLCLLFAAALALTWAPVLRFRRAVLSYFDALDECLEQMIRGEEDVALPEAAEPESVMARAQLKLARMYEVLKNSGDASERGMREISSLVSDISHQVRTPVSSIKMYLSILSERQLSEDKRKEFLDSAQVQADKLEFLIQSMVKMSRLETGIIQPVPRPSRVSAALAGALGGVFLKAEGKNIDIHVECGEERTAMFDPKWTGEALGNILDNAVKYTQEGGKIAVSVSQGELYTRIDIRDSGKGIAEEAQGAVFQRFYREADAARESGLGLGLYLAREIVSLQKGYIMLASKPGEGSLFSVFLPNW